MGKQLEYLTCIIKNIERRLDYFIFIKNGYSLVRHAAPFLLAASVLIVLSLPENDLLPKLVKRLDRERSIDWPAAGLTFAACGVYFLMIRAQVRKAYLWPTGDLRRTLLTSIVFLFLLTSIAYGVLEFAYSPDQAPVTEPQTSTESTVRAVSTLVAVTMSQTESDDVPMWVLLWSSLLLGALSLIGIGWSGPASMAESVGVKTPDYSGGRASATELTKVLRDLRAKRSATEDDRARLLRAANGVKSSIEENETREPSWARASLEDADQSLRVLAEEAEKVPIENLATACSGYQEYFHGNLIGALRKLAVHWPAWQLPVGQEEANG